MSIPPCLVVRDVAVIVRLSQAVVNSGIRMTKDDVGEVRGAGHCESCTHHWKIESPAGPKCRGECVKCGEVRLFDSAMLPSLMDLSLASWYD